jgi:transposase
VSNSISISIVKQHTVGASLLAIHRISLAQGDILKTCSINLACLKSSAGVACNVSDITLILQEAKMSQITARLPDELVASLDEAASQLRRTRAEVVRQAVEYYLDDFEDISRSIEVLRDPADPILDWEAVKHDLLRQH